MNVRFAAAVIAATAALGALGCGGEEQPYTPKPAVSGKKASLPAVPTLPSKPKKQGDAYTIWGVTHDLRSRVHNEDVNGKKMVFSDVAQARLALQARTHSTQPADR